VLLVAESAGLAAVLSHLLDPADRLSRLGSLRELAESQAIEAADIVVLDVPPEDRAAAVGQVRRRYQGPLVVLVATDDPSGPRLDDASRLLVRPFSADALRAALVVGGLPAPAPRPAAQAPAAAPARPDLVDRALGLLAALTQSWQARRRVRVAGISAFALLAFTVAFALAAQGGRCGPGCDAFGTGFSPAPTIAPAPSRAPSTAAPERATSTTARPGAPATGAFRGISGGRAATTSTTGAKATTTTTATARRPATTRPATTRPATTQPTTPPTTAPPTTLPPPTTVAPDSQRGATPSG
jgi:hypothetical protein